MLGILPPAVDTPPLMRRRRPGSATPDSPDREMPYRAMPYRAGNNRDSEMPYRALTRSPLLHAERAMQRESPTSEMDAVRSRLAAQ